jgi:hypothetical protein
VIRRDPTLARHLRGWAVLTLWCGAVVAVALVIIHVTGW